MNILYSLSIYIYTHYTNLSTVQCTQINLSFIDEGDVGLDGYQITLYFSDEGDVGLDLYFSGEGDVGLDHYTLWENGHIQFITIQCIRPKVIVV